MGRVAYGVAEAEMRVNALVLDVIDELDLKPAIFQAGLRFNIGSGGKRLTSSQRQKLALARALLRRPDFLLVNRALSQLDGRHSRRSSVACSATRRRAARRFSALCGTWKIRRLASHFDRIIRMEHGRIVGEDGATESTEQQAGASSEHG